jgi:predicted CXXCH cytochrome family protein
VLGDYRHGRALLDTHRLSLLREPLYHADGQILDEVYVYGSFVQSKMYQAGVVCSNCHEPHSAALRAPGNGVCAQCHKPDVYDTADHHHHPAGSTGTSCVDCHMPAKTYMVVDPRRDHSMRIPRPDLSVMIGTPNACNSCHSEQSAEWAVNSLREWGATPDSRARNHARSFSMARQGDSRAVPALLTLAGDSTAAPLWRATAMAELGDFANPQVFELAVRQLGESDPLLRWGAVQALESLPIEQRYRLFEPLLADPSQTVRLEIARSLAEVPLEQLATAQAAALQTLFDEYLSVLTRHADTPESLVELGVFLTARNQWAAAENAYQAAIAANRGLLAAYLNQADLYRLQGREQAGRAVLMDASRIAPAQGAVWHALGLLEVRAGNRARALEYLEKAAAMEQAGIRFRYVYGIALHDSGDTRKALDSLKPLLREAPDNPDLLVALATYSKELGLRQDAVRYAARLRELMPGDAGVQQFYDSL